MDSARIGSRTCVRNTTSKKSLSPGPDGKVYVANGQVYVYGADGKQPGRIDVPARPLQLIFGGPDRRTLFILTHHALYAAQI